MCLSDSSTCALLAEVLIILAKDPTRRSSAIARKILDVARKKYGYSPADFPESVADHKLLVAAGGLLGVCIRVPASNHPEASPSTFWYGSEEFEQEQKKRTAEKAWNGPGFLEVCFREGKPVAGYYYFPGRGTGLGAVAKTVPGPKEGELLVDLDGKGRLVGVEILDPSSFSIEKFNDVLREYGEDPVDAVTMNPVKG